MRKSLLVLMAFAACGTPRSPSTDRSNGFVVTAPVGSSIPAAPGGGILLGSTGYSVDPAAFVSGSTTNKLLVCSGNPLKCGLADSTAQKGQVIAFAGTNPAWVAPSSRNGHLAAFFDEDFNVKTGATSGQFGATTLSSGSFTVAAGNALHPGVWTYSTAANAAGGGQINTNPTGISLDATDKSTAEWIVDLRTLDDGTDTYQFNCGFGDTAGTAQADGAGFLYNKTTALTGAATSPKWQIFVANGSSRTYATLDGTTTDTVDSTVAVGDMSAGTGQIYDLMTTCTTARCDFCINNTDTDGYCHPANADYSGQPASTGRVGSACSSGCSMVATNIPASGNSHLFGMNCVIVKTAATAVARIMDVDWAAYYRPFSTAR